MDYPDYGWEDWVARAVGDPVTYDFATDLLMDHRLRNDLRLDTFEKIEEHLPIETVNLLVNVVMPEIWSPELDSRIRAFLRTRPEWELTCEMETD